MLHDDAIDSLCYWIISSHSPQQAGASPRSNAAARSTARANQTAGGHGMTEKQQLYKILGPDRMPCNGGTGQWPEPGTWRTVTGKLVPCENGLHLCRPQDLLTWLRPGREVWLAEVEGMTVEAEDKIVARTARLVGDGPVIVWTERLERLLACDYAEHVLPIYERQYPDDQRPRQAIETARRYAEGQATQDELTAAGDAAWSATWAAVRDAALSSPRAVAYAAWATAGDAARAARDAAEDVARAARAAACDAAYAAWATAGAAAWDAAYAAAWDVAYAAGAAQDAARAAAEDVERFWQASRLMEYVEGRAK